MLSKKNKYISMSREPEEISVGPQPESQRRLPAANLTVKHGGKSTKTIHICSD